MQGSNELLSEIEYFSCRNNQANFITDGNLGEVPFGDEIRLTK